DKKVPIDFSSFSLTDDEVALIKNNILKFAELTPNLFSLREQISTDNDNSMEVSILNNYIDENPTRFIDGIIQKAFWKQQGKKYKNFNELLLLIIQDNCKNENKRISDTKYINSGNYSAVFGIGDKVIKLGKDRITKTFPNNPYIVQPLLRKTINIDNDTFFVEITERVDTSNKDITDEDLYNLYKNIRNLGLMWNDVARKNVGRLLKDNVIHWNSNLKLSDQALELDKKRGTIILKKGDLVLFDDDFIYDENDKMKQYATGSIPLQKVFEKRYQQEIKSQQLFEMQDTENLLAENKDKKALK
ncbi:MAG: hypothetical protein J6B87_06725, partial [Clostridia bacterium]|nr:hypothetical protein [Clostridia bacterium]